MFLLLHRTPEPELQAAGALVSVVRFGGATGRVAAPLGAALKDSSLSIMDLIETGGS